MPGEAHAPPRAMSTELEAPHEEPSTREKLAVFMSRPYARPPKASSKGMVRIGLSGSGFAWDNDHCSSAPLLCTVLPSSEQEHQVRSRVRPGRGDFSLDYLRSARPAMGPN